MRILKTNHAQEQQHSYEIWQQQSAQHHLQVPNKVLPLIDPHRQEREPLASTEIKEKKSYKFATTHKLV